MKRLRMKAAELKRGALLKAAACVAAVVFLCGCDTTFNRDKFDRNLMAGRWVSGTVHEYYDLAGTGYTWDTSDDVTEEEAQHFTWTLERETLTQIHQMEMGGSIPKTYTLKKLNASVLEYSDNYGNYHSFTKER